MIPTCTCPRCHGERIDPSTKDLPESERKDCRRCGGRGDLIVMQTHDIRLIHEGERMTRRLEAA